MFKLNYTKLEDISDNMSKFLILASILILNSCTYLILESEKKNIQFNLKKDNKIRYCSQFNTNNESFLNNNSSASTEFQIFLFRLKQKKIRLSFIEKVVSWSLVQMIIRPDLSSPTSQMNMLIRHRNTTHYWNFYSKNRYDFPYLTSLNEILKFYGSKKSLKMISKIIDKHLSKNILIDKSFHNFLLKNKTQFAKNKIFKNIYFKGSDILREEESIPRINLITIINLFAQSKTKQNLFIRKKITTNFCNFSNKKQIFKRPLIGNTFSYKDFNNNSFIAISGQSTQEVKPLLGTHFFQGHPQNSAFPLCLIKKDNKILSLISTSSRSPSQHIEHLKDLVLAHNITSVETIDLLQQKSRYMTLESPTRILYEGYREMPQELKKIINNQSSHYHVRHLGKMWGEISEADSAGRVYKSHLFSDPRSPGILYCPKIDTKK